ncbi:hypothetical protein ACLB2K_059469 [Fragaria x ananassa]
MLMSTSRISDIVPGTDDIKIKVRVSRMWRGKILRLVQQYDGLRCVLVDEHSDSIHVLVMEADAEDVLSNMAEGHVYEISKFRNMMNQESHQVVPHITQLQFNNKTVFKLMREEFPAIPIHCFNLLDYNELLACKKINTIFTGISRYISQSRCSLK